MAWVALVVLAAAGVLVAGLLFSGSEQNIYVLPDVPAVSEVLPGYDIPFWTAIFAPATPRITRAPSGAGWPAPTSTPG